MFRPHAGRRGRQSRGRRLALFSSVPNLRFASLVAADGRVTWAGNVRQMLPWASAAMPLTYSPLEPPR